MADQIEIPEAMDEHDAATLLDQMTAEPEPKKLPPKDPATGKFVKKEKAEEPAEEEGEAEEPEAESEEPEDEAPEGETKEEKEIRLLKVKLDGMEQEVPEEEVVKGYQRQADYTKKTQELAEMRRRFEAEEVAAVREEREYYKQNVERLLSVLNELDPDREPDWVALSKDLPPEEFSQRYAAYKSRQQAKEKLNAEHARMRELHEQETSRERAARLAKELEALEAAIPEMKDPEKGKVLREDLTAYAKSLGFSDDDIGNIEDHRALVILDKARRYDESLKRRPTVEAKVEKAIAGLKPAGAPAKPKAKEVESLRTKLKSGGSVDDAAALLDKLMG